MSKSDSEIVRLAGRHVFELFSNASADVPQAVGRAITNRSAHDMRVRFRRTGRHAAVSRSAGRPASTRSCRAFCQVGAPVA
jgi:hypothetical protein